MTFVTSGNACRGVSCLPGGLTSTPSVLCSYRCRLRQRRCRTFMDSIRSNRPRSTGIRPSPSTYSPTWTVGTDAQRDRPATQQQPRPIDNLRQGDYWMRSVSFAGLHRILSAVADAPDGLTAGEINELVLSKGLTLTPNNPRPAPTTLYHYRNTLLRLQAIIRTGRTLKANIGDPEVRELLRLPVPVNGDQSLNDCARDRFAELVLRNEQCRLIFFDLFMPPSVDSTFAAEFRRCSSAVQWRHRRSSNGKTEVVFHNRTTGRTARCTSPVSKNAIMYGLRYWARNELRLIDEYCAPGGGRTIMFPLSASASSTVPSHSSVMETVKSLLSLRTSEAWSTFSIYDLIVSCCEVTRKPRATLFRAIDWLLHEWPYHTVPIATSPALATLNALSLRTEDYVLSHYYRHANGPYISHIRVHKDVDLVPRRTSVDV